MLNKIRSILNRKPIEESLADDVAKFAAMRGAKVTTSAEVKQKTAEVMAKRERERVEAEKNAPKKDPVVLDPKYPLGGRDPASGRSYSEETELTNPYVLNEISAELANSYLEKSKAAGSKDFKQVARRFAGSMRAHGAIHRDELKKMGDRLAQQRQDLGLQKKDVAEGMQQKLRKYLPGYAKRQIDKKMDAGKFGRTDVDKDTNFNRYKKIQDKLTTEESKGLYYYVNKRKKAGISRDADHPKAPSAQDWKNAAKTAKNEDVEQIDELSKETLKSYADKAADSARVMPGTGTKSEGSKKTRRMMAVAKVTSKLNKEDVEQETNMKSLTQIISEAETKIHPDAIHVKPVKVNGEQKYHVHAVGSNFADGIKVGEHLSDSELDDASEMGGRIKHVK